jgi:LAS superfamily LD-carboxypeptidase LdcB
MVEVVTHWVDPGLVLGTSDAGLIEVPVLGCLAHPIAMPALQDLATSASQAGFDLQVASSYRSFDRQLHIWNTKATGARPVLDLNGQVMDLSSLSDKEKIFAIMRWSALPGASRHHWGTDFDVYDALPLEENYQLQLTLEETEGDGPFAFFHQWLNEKLMDKSSAFFRPYKAGLGGIAPEPWHLSYAPIANIYSAQLSKTLLQEQIQITDIALKDTLLENFDEIYQHFIYPYCYRSSY